MQGDGSLLAFDVGARIAAIDQKALRRYRLERTRAQLRRLDYMGAVLSDPLNIDYATGTRNMPVWTMHAPGRYAFIATEGPVILFEFSSCQSVSRSIETIDAQRIGISAFYLFGGPRTSERASQWAAQIADLVYQHGGKNRRLAVDRCDPGLAQPLQKLGIELFDAQEPLEQARSIKSHEEIACLQLAMDVCDAGVVRMRESLEAGLTENQLWARFHETNIAHGGEYIECRLLASGSRTFPWFQEASNRPISAGDIVTFDTDMIGPMGYLADISRAYICSGRKASAHQRRLYALAQEQVTHNVGLLRPGVTFHELAEKSWKVPEEFHASRYMVLAHGVGLTDEYPAILYDGDQQREGYDGVFEENMVISVESYVGNRGGGEGVKLEQQVLVTGSGTRLFSRTPFDDVLGIG